MTEKESWRQKEKKSGGKKPNRYKQESLDRRRLQVFALWLWGFKGTEITEIVRVSVRTVYNDLEIVERWKSERQVIFKEIRNRIELQLEDVMKGMKLDLMRLKKPETRLKFSNLVAEHLIDIWKKLMPTEIRFEGIMKPEIPKDEYDRVKKEMRSCAPGNR